MELVPYTEAGSWYTEASETDPVFMAELGGPWPADEIPRIHARRLAHIAKGAWFLMVVPEPGARPVGAVTLWQSEFRGEPISEAGWGILPAHQGRGHATAAVRLLLERARQDGRWGDIHAFPGASNGPSNGICAKTGFELLEEVEVDYGDRVLRCNHWIWRGDWPIPSARARPDTAATG